MKTKSDFLLKAEAQKELSMSTHTFDRYCLIFGLSGEKRGRMKLYKREDVERVKDMLDSSVQAAIACIQMKSGKKIRQIIFED